jgi:hypothetical protein
LSELTAQDQAVVRSAMESDLQGIDLTQRVVTLPDAVAGPIRTLRGEIARSLLSHDFAKGGPRPTALMSEAQPRQPMSASIHR